MLASKDVRGVWVSIDFSPRDLVPSPQESKVLPTCRPFKLKGCHQKSTEVSLTTCSVSSVKSLFSVLVVALNTALLRRLAWGNRLILWAGIHIYSSFRQTGWIWKQKKFKPWAKSLRSVDPLVAYPGSCRERSPQYPSEFMYLDYLQFHQMRTPLQCISAY